MPCLFRATHLAVSAVLTLALLAACKREEIRAYTVLKQAAASTPAAAVDATPSPKRAMPQLGYVLPPGWEKVEAGAMSLASFRIKTAAGEASVTITPLARLAGQETAVVNMWREQMGQPPLSDADAAKVLAPVEIAGDHGQLFELVGERDGHPSRIVTAFAHRRDASWFFKLQGPEAMVAAQKPVFVEFLQAVQISERAPISAQP